MAITLDGSNGITTPGGATTDDITFADNDKAIFGAGSDLQIYHDGSNSYISDQGTNDLKVLATDFQLKNSADNEFMMTAVTDGAVTLYHNNVAKLATTSTGVAVTGSTAHTAGDITNTISGTYNLNGANGTAGSPSYATYSFKDDPNTGMYRAAADTLTFATAGSERMRLDSSGNLLAGTTTSTLYNATSGTGLSYRNGVALDIARENTGAGQPLINLNLTGTDGDHLLFYKDGTNIGSIGVVNGDHLYIAATYSTGTGIKFSNNLVKPVFDSGADKDNAADFGSSSARWDDLYATNGTIQTSDFNEKQDIASLTATEMLVGKRISALFKTFRWKDSVAENGDNARTHTGVIAQDVQAAFTAEGLDAGDYALFISSTWWEHDVDVPAVEAVDEVTDEDGNVTTEAVEAVDAYTRTDTYDTEAEAPEGSTSKTRMGIRYPELLSFVAAYNEQRFASIEARLTALEA